MKTHRFRGRCALHAMSAFLFLTICSGCVPIPIPYYGVTQPGASGEILDASSNKPVGRAIVTLNATNTLRVDELDPYMKPWPFVARVETTADGKYYIPPERGLRAWLLPYFGESTTVQCQLLVTHPSYEPYERYFSVRDELNAFWLIPATADLSSVYLTPASNHAGAAKPLPPGY